MRLTWAQPEDLLPHEFVQARREGKPVEDVARRWVEAGGSLEPTVSGASPNPASAGMRSLARTLLAEVDALAADPEDTANEPSDWPSIVSVLPAPPRVPSLDPSTERERLTGAWLGRCAGCVVGKPVEKIPREGIKEHLTSRGSWPLEGLFTAVGLPEEVLARWPWNRRSAPTSLEENLSGMPEDDDLNYPLLTLDLLERFGPAFTTDNVATLWLDSLPAGRTFTAERAAYRNILDARPVPETATHLNPFREWIGGLIRGDAFGWILPGQPIPAAELAVRDARLTHTRAGIHGEAWAAALASVSLVADDVTTTLSIADAVVPPRGALRSAIDLGRSVGRELAEELEGREWRESGDSIDSALDELHSAYGHLHWVHVLNNAATIACALEAGRGDFTKSVGIGVMSGWDTDSVGATIGAIVGALGGTPAIPSQIYSKIGGILMTSLPGGDVRTIDSLVDRTLVVRKQLITTFGGRS